MIKRIRIPGSERYSLPFLTRYYSIHAIAFDFNPVNRVNQWNYISFIGFGGGPVICKNGYVYAIPTDGEFATQNKWIDVDPSILRGYDKMQIDTNEPSGIDGGNIYVYVLLVRV
jgi:hypothetical protein